MSEIKLNDNYAEKAVLGSLLLDNSKWDEIEGILQPSDFNINFHRQLFCTIRNLISAGKVADIITVSQCMNGEADNFIEIAEIANSVFSPVNIKSYAEIIRQRSIDKKMIDAANKVIVSVHERKENRLDHAQKYFHEIDVCRESNALNAIDIIGDVLRSIEDRHENSNGIVGISTGFVGLDRLTQGLHAGDLIILAGRPGMGKTMFALNVCEHVSIRQKRTVLIFSLEMGKAQLLERVLVSISGVDATNIKSGKLNTSDWKKMTDVLSQFNEAKLFLDDRASISVAEIRSQCRRIKRDHGLSLIVVDYITLVAGDGENETVRVGKITRDLKLLARDLSVPVIAISQLNRSVEYRKDKIPSMADLRQSGSIEQDADLILFLSREDTSQLVNLTIAKHRNGETGMVRLIFNGKSCRFSDCASSALSRTSHDLQKSRALDY